jgi:hypothetical protein
MSVLRTSRLLSRIISSERVIVCLQLMEEAEAREDGFRGQIWKGLKQLSIDGCVSLELLSRQNVNQRVVAGQAWG